MKKEFKWIKNNNLEDNKIKVEMELKETAKGLCFSCVGEVYGIKTGQFNAGQCEERINEILAGDKLWDEIYIFWKKYHLNDMRAGTPAQEEFLKKNRNEDSNYESDKKILEENNLLIDNHNGKPYQYGSAWLFQEIPSDDLKRIKEIISGISENRLYSVEDNLCGELTQFTARGDKDIILSAISAAKAAADENYDDYISWKKKFFESINKTLSEKKIQEVVEIQKIVFKN